ncbi:MAG: exosortase V [Sphingomonadaceae bacterium]|uniref:exosortase V n=1 Tax=Thermaurantiacus sp. TaxID=2820283 RepID=UPI00298F374B|nr:exosortase V [Thermaurantiacus sp.]MCS6986091.1 exosortase V [Sphingomonadaceae bacterium]MDW8414693.1 exosortase V [Thermaurantiacus sp.]
MASLRLERMTGWIRPSPLLALALVAVVVPTLFSMARESWTREEGIHGPIVLATAGWLLWRRWDEIRANARPGSLPVAAAAVTLAAIGYTFGRAYGFLVVEVGALYVALVAVAYAFIGWRMLRRLWFPIVYLGFAIPLPGWLLDGITLPLKHLVSHVVTTLMSALGFPIVQVGVTLFVAQYQLLVEDACAGLNSIISLTAVGLFYIYLLHNASWRCALVLVALLLPIAIAANVIRVIILVLITYYLGDEMAQGYLHETAGIVTYVAALLLIFLIDGLLTPLRRRLSRRRDHAAAA